MGEFDCTSTPHYAGGIVTGYCVDCPEVPAIAPTPAQVITDPHVGWNASARSVAIESADCFTEFTNSNPVRGAVIGLAPAGGRGLLLPREVAFGFYLYQSAGAEWWRVLEAGVAKTAPVRRDPETDVFRIERGGSAVRYFFNGRQLYVSATPSRGPLQVVACLYSADDGVD